MDFHHESDFSYSCRNRRDFLTSWIFKIGVGFSTLLHNWLCLPACFVWSLGPAHLCRFDPSQSLASILFHLLWAWKLPQNLGVSKMNIYFAHESSVCAGLGGDSWCLPHTTSAGVAWTLGARIFWSFTHSLTHSLTYLVVDAGFWLKSWVGFLAGTPSMWPLHVVWASYKYCGWVPRARREGGRGRERERGRENFTIAWQACSITCPGFYSLRESQSPSQVQDT